MKLPKRVNLVVCSSVIFGLCSLPMVSVACVNDFAQERAEVLNGTRTEAIASWWCFDATDATPALQAAIDSGAERVIVDNTGSDWIVTPITLRSNQEIVFEDGVIVRAKTGSFQGRNDALFEARDTINTTLRGEGEVRFIMNKADYRNPALYSPGEWRNSITLRSVDGFALKNLTIESSGGDGIYIGRSSNTAGSKNVLIEDVTCLDHYRQGISVISVDGLMIRNCVFNSTEGTAPAAGIDFEPNKADEWLANCVIEDSVFDDNAGAGILIYLKHLNETSTPVSILIKNSQANGNRVGVDIYSSITQLAPSGLIRVEDTIINGNQNGGINISGQQEDRLRLEFVDTSINNAGSTAEAIRFISNQPYDVDNVLFDIAVKGGSINKVLGFIGRSGGGIDDIEGTVTFENANGTISNIDLAAFVAAHPEDLALKNFPNAGNPELIDLVPLTPSADPVGTGKVWQMRSRSVFMQYSDGVNPVTIDFEVKPVGAAAIKTTVLVRDPSYTEIESFTFTTLESSYTLNFSNPGVYYFEINSGKHSLFASSDTAGNGWGATDRMGLIYTKGPLYFIAPPNTGEFSVEVSGHLNEAVTARLFNPLNQLVGEVSNIQDTQLITGNAGNVNGYTIWRLDIHNAREDYNLRLGAPLIPIISPEPENLLIYESMLP